MQTYPNNLILQNPPSNSDLKAAKVGTPIGLSMLQDYNKIESDYNISYPVCQLSKTKLLVYNYHTNRKKRDKEEIQKRECDTSKKFTGEISKRTKQKIKHIVETWLNAAKEFAKSSLCPNNYYKPTFTFITLTLSSTQTHSDKEIKRELLNHFLIWLQREKECKNNIWKAESQKNGNIHFHILVDNYVNWQDIREKWNAIQNKLGYIDRFEAVHKHRNPNSTDIHSLKNVKNPAAYISKYICKDESYRKIEGRIWSCSKSLGNIKKFEFLPDWRTWELISILLKKKDVFSKVGESFTVICGDIEQYIKDSLKSEYTDLCNYLASWWEEQYFSTA